MLVCAGVYAFRIVSVNKILSFTNTLIIIIAGQIRYCNFFFSNLCDCQRSEMLIQLIFGHCWKIAEITCESCRDVDLHTIVSSLEQTQR